MWQLVTSVKCKHRASNSWTNLRINRICDLCFFLLLSFSMLPLSWLLGSPFQTNLHSSEALRKVWDSLRLLDSDTKKAFEPGRYCQFMFNHPLEKIGKSENLSVFANACNPLSAGRSPICFFFCVFHAPVYYILLLYYFPSPWLNHSWVYDIHWRHRRNLQIKWQIKWILEIRKQSHQGQGEIQGDPSPTQWGKNMKKMIHSQKIEPIETAAFARGFVLPGAPGLLLNVQRGFSKFTCVHSFPSSASAMSFRGLGCASFLHPILSSKVTFRKASQISKDLPSVWVPNANFGAFKS